jgi:hypothetical protein
VIGGNPSITSGTERQLYSEPVPNTHPKLEPSVTTRRYSAESTSALSGGIGRGLLPCSLPSKADTKGRL